MTKLEKERLIIRELARLAKIPFFEALLNYKRGVYSQEDIDYVIVTLKSRKSRGKL